MPIRTRIFPNKASRYIQFKVFALHLRCLPLLTFKTANSRRHNPVLAIKHRRKTETWTVNSEYSSICYVLSEFLCACVHSAIFSFHTTPKICQFICCEHFSPAEESLFNVLQQLRMWCGWANYPFAIQESTWNTHTKTENPITVTPTWHMLCGFSAAAYRLHAIVNRIS